MGQEVLIVIMLILLSVPVVFFFAPGLSGGMMRPTYEREVRALINPSAPRRSNIIALKKALSNEELIDRVTKEQVKRSPSSTLTLQKRLKFARWRINPLVFRSLECSISLLVFLALGEGIGEILRVFSLITGPLLMRSLLNFSMNSRFKRFDTDYPQFLLSVVALLKSGMTPTKALETAAQGLSPQSLVREEVFKMIERMRLGVPEDRSIGSFGDNIYHPEIELFVQALLLSRRVGGNLSDSLERLSRQVRKRQYFRNSAVAAVSLQRGSVWVILGILFALEVYIYLTYPSLVTEAINDEFGWKVWQGSLVSIFLGVLWVRIVTNIKI